MAQLFGSLEGIVSIANHVSNTVLCSTREFVADHDAILGLCWYREANTRRFFAASGAGTIKLCHFDTSGITVVVVYALQ